MERRWRWGDRRGGEEKEGGEERLGDGERGRREGERKDGDEREQQQGPDGAMEGVLDPAAVPGLRREEVGGPANMLRKCWTKRAQELRGSTWVSAEPEFSPPLPLLL